MKTVVGLYNNVEDARHVVHELTASGIRSGDITLLAGDAEKRYAGQLAVGDPHNEADAAVDGAVVGGLLGGMAGALLGLTAFAIPGLGPVIAAGPLVSGLLGAGIGAAGGGLIGALVEWGISREEAEFYLEGVRRGGVLVAVRTPDEQVKLVARIMDQQGLIDLEAAAESWEAEGWSGFQAAPYDDIEFDTLDNAYRGHYEQAYAGSAFPYDDVVPAYRFGYSLATDPHFKEQEWAELEPAARRAWEEEHDGEWERYRDAVQYSWEQARGTTETTGDSR